MTRDRDGRGPGHRDGARRLPRDGEPEAAAPWQALWTEGSEPEPGCRRSRGDPESIRVAARTSTSTGTRMPRSAGWAAAPPGGPAPSGTLAGH